MTEEEAETGEEEEEEDEYIPVTGFQFPIIKKEFHYWLRVTGNRKQIDRICYNRKERSTGKCRRAV